MFWNTNLLPGQLTKAFQLVYKRKRVKNGGKKKIMRVTIEIQCKFCGATTHLSDTNEKKLRTRRTSALRAHVQICPNINPRLTFV